MVLCLCLCSVFGGNHVYHVPTLLVGNNFRSFAWVGNSKQGTSQVPGTRLVDGAILLL